MNALIASLQAQLAQVSSQTSGAAAQGSNSGEISQIKAQLQSAQSALSSASQSDASQVSQIASQLASVQSSLAQLMVSSGKTTGLVSTTA
ncbi:hypothetical protein [Paraburkholderia sp. CNPSo 3281]|uniref:hypothetical protein n=1 Tax=Paraburkholderia sp. CNPSo 3281 TaxID=2940933 RepID=UPI0020B8989C|nr:hypothetical protein [Paraburkholderia sp. CNPSo 3281]MCP3717509.1 hypothetical protein [Paraburkholderia sp. CNPSo 3281]